MRIALFSVQPYEEEALHHFNIPFKHEITITREALTEETVSQAAGYPAVSVFANDIVNASILSKLAQNGTRLVTLRCAGFNNVDLKAAAQNDITIMRVPTYSPHAIAEYTVGMVIALDRRIPHARERIRAGNFDLDGLVGAGVHGKTVGIFGTGKIGAIVAKVFRQGFDCEVLAHDLYHNQELLDIGVRYVDREELLRQSDIVCLHCPLMPDTRHLINADTLKLMKPGTILVNTGRGGLVHTEALIDALEAGRIRGCSLDVYEGEENFFLHGPGARSSNTDKNFQRLVNFTQVIVTGHQAFLTEGAINAIAKTTMQNVADFENGTVERNVVTEHGKV